MAMSPIGNKNFSAMNYLKNTNTINFKGYNESKSYFSDTTTKTEPENNISRTRLAFNYLTDEQIEEINKTGMLPKNAKFIKTGDGNYAICNNFFNIQAGTQKLPAGYEVKRNALGFAIVVPEGTQGLMIRG